MKKLTLVRGLPGSGKSTLANHLDISSVACSIHLEADMFHVNQVTGEYRWDVHNVHKAHEWCQKKASYWLDNGRHVIVSNTFTTIKELKPYFTLAQLHSIIPNVIHCQSNYGNIHDVPMETLVKMKNRFQYDISSLFEGLK